MPSSLAFTRNLMSAEDRRAMDCENREQLEKNLGLLTYIVQANVPHCDDKLLKYLVETCRSKTLVAYMQGLRAAQNEVAGINTSIEQTLAAVNVPDVAVVLRRMVRLNNHEIAYRRKPYNYISCVLEKAVGIAPIMTFNREHPKHPITTETIKGVYEPNRNKVLSILRGAPLKEARKVIETVAHTNPDWEQDLARYEKGLRVFANMKKGQVLLHEKAEVVTQACRTIQANLLAAKKQSEFASDDAAMKTLWKAVAEELDVSDRFDVLTHSWPTADRKAAKKYADRISFHRSQLG